LKFNLQAAIRSLVAYGTSEGVKKEWDERGRGRKESDSAIEHDGWVTKDGTFYQRHGTHAETAVAKGLVSEDQQGALGSADHINLHALANGNIRVLYSSPSAYGGSRADIEIYKLDKKTRVLVSSALDRMAVFPENVTLDIRIPGQNVEFNGRQMRTWMQTGVKPTPSVAQFHTVDASHPENPRTPIEDTGEYNELKEEAVRSLAQFIGYYAEEGPLFDPEGKYLCADCCLRDGKTACTHVSGKISMQTGSCMIWIVGEPINLQVGQKLTQIESNYVERPKSKAFGCSRCGWAKEAKKPDNDGRGLWCSWWGCRVRSMACCLAESGPDLVAHPGE
jgi:hypothetical protein